MSIVILRENFAGQPMAHDQMALLYNAYKVTGSKIRVNIINNGLCQARVAVCPTSSAAALTDVEEAIEQRRSTSRHITVKGGALDYCNIKKYTTTKAMLGKTTAGDDDSAGLMGANPDDQWYWHITAESGIPSGSNYLHLFAEVKVTYYVEFSDPLVLARS